jgi:hypothetical protein
MRRSVLLRVERASGAQYAIAFGTPACRIYGFVSRAGSATLPDATASPFGGSHVLGFAARAMPSELRCVHTFSTRSAGMSPHSSTGKTHAMSTTWPRARVRLR